LYVIKTFLTQYIHVCSYVINWTGSIVSKKAAEGLAALVLDVKVGKAALLSDETAARQLAQLLVTCLHNREA